MNLEWDKVWHGIPINSWRNRTCVMGGMGGMGGMAPPLTYLKHGMEICSCWNMANILHNMFRLLCTLNFLLTLKKCHSNNIRHAYKPYHPWHLCHIIQTYECMRLCCEMSTMPCHYI
jgi:hypothetical protein